MYRDLFLNGNVTTFIYSEVAPWQRIFPPIYLPMAIWPYGYIAGRVPPLFIHYLSTIKPVFK